MHSGSLVASHTNKQKCLEGVWDDSPIRRAVQIGQRKARKVGSAENSHSSLSLSRSGVPSSDNWKLAFHSCVASFIISITGFVPGEHLPCTGEGKGTGANYFFKKTRKINNVTIIS